MGGQFSSVARVLSPWAVHLSAWVVHMFNSVLNIDADPLDFALLLKLFQSEATRTV